MAEEFKLPASPYETMVKIIKAYGHSNGPRSNIEISKLIGISQFDVSRNSGFLSSLQIIEGSKSKSITSKGEKISHALEHNIDEAISNCWNEILTENEFIKTIIMAVKIRNGMDIQSLQSHIAYSSGQKNNQYVKTGSSTLIEIMKIAKIFTEEEGKLVVTKTDNQNHLSKRKDIDDSVPLEETKDSLEKVVVNFDEKYKFPDFLKVNIEIKIEASVNQLDDLKIKLKSLVEEMKKSEE